jgi:type II secretory pathway component HofQ
MRHQAIVLVFVAGCAAAPAPTPVARTPIANAEPCPEPEPAESFARTVPRYETRVIGTESRGPRFVGRAIDLDLKDADIGNVCRLLADVGKVNIVLADGVQGNVTLMMRHVPWDQALAAVIEAKNLDAERDGNVIIVKTRSMR